MQLLIPKDGKKHAYCLDGQHRLYAFDLTKTKNHLEVNPEDYQLPVTAAYNESLEFISDLFAVINIRQEKVDKGQIFTMEGFRKALLSVDQRTFSVIELLNKKPGGPFEGRIYMRPGDKGWLIKNITLLGYLKPKLEMNGLFGDPDKLITEAVAAQHINNYFEAWKQLFPDQWGSKVHVLTKTAGWSVIFALLDEAYHRMQAYKGGVDTTENWKEVLKCLKTRKINLQDPNDPSKIVPKVVDWNSAEYRPFCSGAANIERFTRAFVAAYKGAPPP